MIVGALIFWTLFVIAWALFASTPASRRLENILAAPDDDEPAAS